VSGIRVVGGPGRRPRAGDSEAARVPLAGQCPGQGAAASLSDCQWHAGLSPGPPAARGPLSPPASRPWTPPAADSEPESESLRLRPGGPRTQSLSGLRVRRRPGLGLRKPPRPAESLWHRRSRTDSDSASLRVSVGVRVTGTVARSKTIRGRVTPSHELISQAGSLPVTRTPNRTRRRPP
jgi:hypothetical protein